MLSITELKIITFVIAAFLFGVYYYELYMMRRDLIKHKKYTSKWRWVFIIALLFSIIVFVYALETTPQRVYDYAKTFGFMLLI